MLCKDPKVIIALVLLVLRVRELMIGLFLAELHELVPGYKTIDHRGREVSKFFSHLGAL